LIVCCCGSTLPALCRPIACRRWPSPPADSWTDSTARKRTQTWRCRAVMLNARQPRRLKPSEEIVIMPTFIEQIHAKAKTSPRKVVLQEGEDVRIIEAGALATKQGIAEITLLGAPDKIRATAAAASLSLDKINIVDMTKPPNFDDYASAYFEVRKAMVDSFVGGALYTTGDVCRAGIQIIGMQPGLKTLSSFFAMVVSDKSFGKDGIVFFADCA